MELWDIYDKDRVKTGKTMVRGSEFAPDCYHMVVHVCIFNSKGELLIQQRQPFKEGFPNMWDVTVGGSATTGGTDMLASMLHRVLPVIRVSYAIFFIDGLVIAASAFVFEPQAAMYGLISAFISNVLVDVVLEGPNAANAYFIISDQSEAIAQRILQEMDRGVTALHAMGMYRRTEKQVLLCVVNRFQTMQLRRLVFAVDPQAFVFSSRAHEVLGEGFTSDK